LNIKSVSLLILHHIFKMTVVRELFLEQIYIIIAYGFSNIFI
jgi:hypothetical protein